MNEFEPINSKGVFCSVKCKQKNYRKSVAQKLQTLKELQRTNEPENGLLYNIKKSNPKPFKHPSIDEVKNLIPDNLEKQIEAIKAEVKPSFIPIKNWERNQQKRISELKNKLK